MTDNPTAPGVRPAAGARTDDDDAHLTATPAQATSGPCRDCGRPFTPDHDSAAPGPTVRHPFVPVHPFTTAQAASGQRETCECGHRRGYHDAIGNCWHLDEAGDEDCGCNQYRVPAAVPPGETDELREQIARELRTRLLPGIPVEAPAGPGWLEQADSLLSLPAVARLLAAQAAVQRVRELADDAHNAVSGGSVTAYDEAFDAISDLLDGEQ